MLDASNDHDYVPDQALSEGDCVEGPDWRLIAVETPGHMANHLAFALPQEQALFSADHVMAWSTTGSIDATVTSRGLPGVHQSS